MTPFGKITGSVPYTLGKSVHGILEFTPEITTISKAKILFVIDTGFTGYVSIPGQQMGILKTTPIGQEEFELADDRLIIRPVYLGMAKFGKVMHKISIIPGKALIGMALINKFFTELRLDLSKGFIYVSLKR